MKLIRFLIIISICFAQIAKANIIRDSEIQETIDLIIAPLKKSAKLPYLKIHIVDNPTPNAFTAGGNDIFVNSGLIIDFPDPDIPVTTINLLCGIRNEMFFRLFVLAP